MITTVVFDLDDTLYDEIEYCETGFKTVAEFLAQLPETPSAGCIFEAFWKQFNSSNRKNTFNAALDDLGVSYDGNLIAELVNAYRNHIPTIKLTQDSQDVLSELVAKYTLALITDGYLPAQQLKVESLGIKKYFKCIVYTEQLGREFWKPSPAGFERIIQTLNTKPENMVYIGDNEKKDFIAPNRLGFFTVQLLRPARLHTKVSPEPDGHAQYVIHEITQFPALLEGL